MIASYSKLRSFLKGAAGVVLDADRQYVAAARLAPLARKFGEPDVDALVRRLDSTTDAHLEQSVIDAMMTNETFFFRDRMPFELFEHVILPQFLKSRREQRKIRIWCAACSTGQEPYSIAMLLDQAAKALAGWRVEIIATDVSRSALDIARMGRYNQFEVQRGLPVNLLLRYFNRSGDDWQLAEHLRARVSFREINLIADFGHLGEFDIVFCRNVLLYFDQQTKADVLARIANVCAPDANLLLGATENVADSAGVWCAHQQYDKLNVLRKGRGAPAPRLRVVASS